MKPQGLIAPVAGGGYWGFPARVLEFSHSILCLSYEATKRGGARGVGSLFSETNFPRHGMEDMKGVLCR